MIEIRFYAPKDLEQVADILFDMSSHYNGSSASSREVVRRNLQENILGADSDVHIVVAMHADRIVGVAMISLLYPAPKERGQLFMKELYVASGYRSQGVGQQIMKWIARYAVSKNCIRFDWTVDADNTEALAFYQEIGAHHVTDKLYFRFGGDALAHYAQN